MKESCPFFASTRKVVKWRLIVLFVNDFGMSKNDWKCFDLAFDRILHKIKETERIKSESKLYVKFSSIYI